MTKQKKKDLQCILTSLYYLSEEAKRRNLPDVSTLLATSISEVAAWLDNGKTTVLAQGSKSLIDDSLYHAMSFIHNLAILSHGRQADFKKLFETISQQFHQQYRIVLKPDETEDIKSGSKIHYLKPLPH